MTERRPAHGLAAWAALLWPAALWVAGPVRAEEGERGWSVGGVAAGVLQCQDVSGNGRDECRGALPVQPGVSFRLDDSSEFGVKLGFAVGDGLGPVSPFEVPVWPADLQGDVGDINGRGRSYLLTAWYRHSLPLTGGGALVFTGGILDGADFLDQNAYANDEFSQFMNGALVNAPNGFVPSYEPGVALEWERGSWSLRGVYMHVGEGESGGHDYVGLQAGYRLQTPLGEGGYRLLWQVTSSDFEAASGDGEVGRSAWIVSADQQLGEVLGAWIRLGWQDDAAAIRFRSLYSGGISIRGVRWGRAEDELALGLGLARGGNAGIDESRVIEGYYRARLTAHLALTADVQRVRDSYRDGTPAMAGWITGLRLTLSY